MLHPRLEKIRSFLDSTPPPIRDARAHARSVARIAEAASRALFPRLDMFSPRIEAANNFSPAEARRAFNWAIDEITGEHLMRLWDQELGGRPLNDGILPGCTAVFCGGVISQPAVRSAVAAAMVSDRVLLRPSAGDPWLTARLFEEMAWIERDLPVKARPDIARRFLAASWPREDSGLTRAIIQRADAIVLFGDEPAVRTLRQMGREGTRWFIYGPKTSLAMLDARGMDLDDADGFLDPLADDILAYNQLGCLSPSTLVIAGASRDFSKRFLLQLSDILRDRLAGGRRPPGLPPGAALQIQNLRAATLMDGRLGIIASNTLPGFTLIMDEEGNHPLHEASPGYQTLFIRFATDLKSILVELERTSANRIQGVAIEGASAERKDIKDRLAALGVSRVCPFGELQCPPLDWRHDGNPFFPVRA